MSDSLRGLWLRGIAVNAAAPADVLIRLLDEAVGEAGLLMCEGRDLPRAVIEAALRHPARRIRRALACDRHVDPARLAPKPPLEDPDDAVRRAAAANPTLKPEALETLLTDSRTAEGAAANPSLPSPACTHSSTSA
ncbi:hypothetical protein QMZ92_33870 [Streptomyces sp. HNM0645]|uniref:hypothetical protein n=1 Tax=Streptomyces sp. HNM0645 TaxID=2782343 RepID=UPI0024B762C9|nr:hypothetical protein [Streptomyces sp. HNM0645]MDI9889190.1 hypothetical protein [Streptomyces sp. HNM0645]